MKKLLFLLTLSAIAFTSCDKDNNDDNQLNQADRDFMMQAAYSNNAEIAAGKMAVNKGEKEAINEFGQMMVDDHTTAQSELETLSAHFTVNLPEGLDSTHQALAKQLDTLEGFKFDSVYINSQIKDHEKAIALFKNGADNGRDASIKNYANKYLPKLQMHLEKAKQIQGQVMQPTPVP